MSEVYEVRIPAKGHVTILVNAESLEDAKQKFRGNPKQLIDECEEDRGFEVDEYDFEAFEVQEA